MRRSNARLKGRLAAWLMAERADDHERAEVSLRQAFRLLPTPRPAVDLVAGTMRRLTPFSRVPAEPRGWGFKVIVGFALTMASAAAAIGPSLVEPWLSTLRPSWLVDAWTATIVGVSQRLASGLTVWRILERVGDMLADALASPATLAALVLAAVMAFVSFRALTGLVSFERSTGNA